jgi:hypothetical protein
MKKTFLFLLISSFSFAQTFTKQDTLKGTNTDFRNFWDVKKYELTVEPNFQEQTIVGENTIYFEIIKDIENPTFQIDLQQPMDFKLINDNPELYKVDREGDFIFISSKKKI